MRVVWLIVLLLLLPAAASANWEREVRDAVVGAGFPDLADRAVRATRAAVLVDRTVLRRTPTALGVSRFGGLPDMPVGEPWPQCAGRAQSFLGQVRVRDLPVSARALRRVGGLLLVFSDIELEDPDGHGLWGRGRALHHDRPRAAGDSARSARASAVAAVAPAGRADAVRGAPGHPRYSCRR